MGHYRISTIAIIWIAGYAAASQSMIPWQVGPLFLVMGVLVFFCVKRTWAPRVAVAFLLAGVSLLYYKGTEHFNQSEIMEKVAGSENGTEVSANIKGRIISQVERDGDRVSFILQNDEGEKLQVFVRLLEETEIESANQWKRNEIITASGTLQQPSEARNFGGFDYRRYLRFKHIHLQLNVKGADEIEVMEGSRVHPAWVMRLNDEFRQKLADQIEQVFPSEQTGFMKSMLIGMAEEVDPQQFAQFSRLGLTHILAVSGLNVAIFVGMLLWLLKRLRLTKETSLTIAIATLPIYILLTGASPSIIRAGGMSMIGLYMVRRGLAKDILQVASLIALLMLLWNPYYLHDVSFQLSFLVTIGLILVVPRFNRLLPIKNKMLNGAVSVTIVAQFLSFPITIYYFNSFSLLSFPANLLFVPFFSLIVLPLGTISLLLGFLFTPVARMLGTLLGYVNQYALEWIGKWSEGLSLSSIWPTPNVLWILLYYILLFLLLHSWEIIKGFHEEEDELSFPQEPSRSKFTSWKLSLFGVSLLLLFTYGYTPTRLDRNGYVDMLDVGQGDSFLIRTPTGKHILVDGGGTLSFRKSGEEWKNRKDPYEVGKKLVVPLLKQRGVHHIDYLILTHEDQDHIGGLQAVLDNIPVKRLLFNGTLKPQSGVKKLFETALKLQIPLIPMRAGQNVNVDEETSLKFLYPEQNPQSLTIAPDQNSLSLVFLMKLKGTNWLFTGDMEADAENELLSKLSLEEEEEPVILDVLKIAHHGSKTSTSDEWLEYWHPKIGLISAGVNNIYGHPHQTVTERLNGQKIPVFRTDQHGEVQFRVANDDIHFKPKIRSNNLPKVN